MSYINKDLKELIITLAAVIGFGDVMVKTGRLYPEDEDAAKLMMGAATTISQHLLQGRDAEQVEALQRQAGFYEIIAVPKSSAQIGKEYYICPKEDFERLVIDDPPTLCWRCAHAAGPEMCSWARDFVPVEGWKATPTMLYANNGSASKPVGSFHVRSCPEFVEG